MTHLHSFLATLSYKSSRRLIEVGFLVALVGALGLAAGGGLGGRTRGGAAAIGGLLLAIGLGIALLVIHFGVSPFRPR